jgi:DNA-binding NarL/FixJ family response regulator
MDTEGSIGSTDRSCVVGDRHPVMRESLALLLEDEGFTVVGKAATGREAIRLLEVHRPTLTVLDLRLGDMTGIEVALETSRLGLGVATVIYVSESTPEVIRHALDAGVRAIAREAVPPAALIHAIAAAVAGETYVDPAFGYTAT